MAYNNYFPQYYQQPVAAQQPAPQTSGFISVPSEEVARSYPIGPGNSVSFKDENAPYIYTKTMGFSQFDQPVFKKYKLIEENVAPIKPEQTDVQNEIKKLWDEINVLKTKMATGNEDDGV